MRGIAWLFVFVPLACGQDFSGTWRLKSQADARGLPEPAAAVIEIEHSGHAVRCTAGALHWSFTTDGKEVRSAAGRRSVNIVAKWEGSALLINAIVSDAGRNFTLMDRWTISRDRRLLTIDREVAGWSTEATLVYERAGAPPAMAAQPTPQPPPPAGYTIAAGTRIPLVLLNAVGAKHSLEGDRVYLRTAYPVVVRGRIVVPPGSDVAGTLTFVKQPGRAAGRGELFIRFDSITLPNGVSRDFRARVDAVDAAANAHVDRQEGAVKGEGDKAGDARTVGGATVAGAAVGGIAGTAAGHGGMGTAVGAAAGAAAGLAKVLLSRGPDTVLAAGGSVEMVLEHPLVFASEEIPH